MTERDFAAQVAQLAALFGWLAYHTFDSRRSAPGFPDLVLVRERRLLFVELKTDRGRLTQEQSEWLEALERAGAEVYVWRPDDLDEIAGTLARRAGEGVS